VDADRIVDRALGGGLLWIAIRFHADVHPLEGLLALLGQPLDHVDRTGADARQEEFTGADLLATGVIGDKVMRTGIADGAPQCPRTVAPYFIGQG